MNAMIPTEQELHAYVDNQLDADRRTAVEAYLAAAPEAAARVAAWQRDAESLRAALAGIQQYPANTALDPAYNRRRLRAQRTQRLSLAASFVLVLVLGGTGGWIARSGYYPGVAAPMADAVDAYRVFATDRMRPVELRSTDAPVLQSWLSNRLGRPMALPDLETYGFKLLGGRLLSTADGPAAMIIYEDAGGQRISFYLRPSTKVAPGTSGVRNDGGLLAKYWFRNGYGFAVVGRASDPRTTEVQDAFPAAI
jgi:anti-sigma factor RsiW